MCYLLTPWGAILKVNLTIQMEPRHLIQDKWEAIPSKNVQGGLRFSDKQLILNLACLINMRFCHFMNHIRTVLSEPSSMVLTLSGKRELKTLPFSSYIWCTSGVVCFSSWCHWQAKFCCGTLQPSLNYMAM